MNLIQQAERLKTLPDQELLAMQQRPTVIAPYLVVAEMQRRQTMRKAATAGQDPVQQTTVAQEMSSRLAGMQPPQQQMQQQMPTAQQMRTGGVVRAQTGLAVGPDLAEVAPNPLTNFAAQMVAEQSVPGAPVPTIGNPFGMALDSGSLSGYGSPTDTAAELAKLRKVRGENPLAKIAEELGLEEQRVRGKKQGIGEILMRLGLGMAASRRPDFLGAIGEGGLGALQGFMQNRQLTQQQADELQRRRLAVMERVQGSEDVLTREAADLARAQNATRNMEIQTIEANRRALANQAAQMQIAAKTAEANERLQMKLSAARTEWEQQKAIADYNNDINKMREEYRLRAELEQKKGQGGGGGREGGVNVEKQLGVVNTMINQTSSQLENIRKAQNAATPEQRSQLEEQEARLVSNLNQFQGFQAKLLADAGISTPRTFDPNVAPPEEKKGQKPSQAPKPRPTPQGLTSLEKLGFAIKGITPAEIAYLSASNPALAGILNTGSILNQGARQIPSIAKRVRQAIPDVVPNTLFDLRQLMGREN